MLRLVLASVLEIRMTVTNRTEESGVRIFLLYLERKVRVTVTRNQFATASTVQSNSIRPKDPATTDDTGWR